MRKIALTLFVIICGLSLFFTNQYFKRDRRTIGAKIHAIPENERKDLEWFFYRLISGGESAAYSLFGDKPFSLIFLMDFPKVNNNKINSINVAIEDVFFAIHELKFMRGYKVWKKYESLFPSKNFVLKRCKSQLQPDADHIYWLIFINKKTFLKTVQENLGDFQKALRRPITAEKLLQEFLDEEDVFDGILKNHHALKGILFGYGKRNAWICQRIKEIEGFLLDPPTIPLRKIAAVVPNPPFYSLEDEREELKNALRTFEHERVNEFNYMFLFFPTFGADYSDPETLKLKEKYYEQYLDILERFRKGSLLEVVLEKYCSD